MDDKRIGKYAASLFMLGVNVFMMSGLLAPRNCRSNFFFSGVGECGANSRRASSSGAYEKTPQDRS